MCIRDRDTTYLPLDMFGEISRAEIDKNGLYNTFYKHGITITRALETIRGICLSEDDAKPVSYTHLDVYKRQERSNLLKEILP